MSGELRAELELKFGLPALFRRHRGDEAIGVRIAQDTRTKLLVDQYASPVLRHSGPKSKLKCVIDDAFGPGDLLGLLRAQDSTPPIEPFSKELRWSKGRM
jgi:hypothetical protein